MIYLPKMEIFHSYVSLPEGMLISNDLWGFMIYKIVIDL